ncbi:unnamed protein product [Lactuca saligna]|uniref:non-specific serine/threonine protein kinase n=1 Tax=Lactuca saligna TaxID=75948 RepID=A0AA35YZ99_LACSI|nr:unnamed protein product [Lactuca saligna]
MKPSLPRSSAPFVFTVILSFGVHFPTIWCQETQRPFDICGESVNCGAITVEYPFWGLNRPAYCGHPGFQLICPSNVPLLNYESVNYRVLRSDTSTQTITIARNDLRESICPRFLYNTSYNSTLFNGDNFDRRNVSLYYNCNTSSTVIPLSANYRFNCNVNESQSDGYFITTDQLIPSVANFLDQCQNRIHVPVNQSSADRLATAIATTDDLRSGLTAGFQLQWTANNNECDRCIRSDGQCGSNSASPDLFACYCANGNFSLTCNNSDGGGALFLTWPSSLSFGREESAATSCKSTSPKTTLDSTSIDDIRSTTMRSSNKTDKKGFYIKTPTKSKRNVSTSGVGNIGERERRWRGKKTYWIENGSYGGGFRLVLVFF